ncbi:hypothetical protein [Nocardia wallacei]|uniref:hypothetical protein n=1 Tax=Nocardia wallacei TaxID=480035 RepID=UPI002458BAB4|nr:hypothetical protein [Nocardia wallacei]
MPDPTPIEQIEAALADLIDAYADLRERYIRNPEDFHALTGIERDIAIEVATYRNAARLLREHRTEDALLGLPSWLWDEWAARDRGIDERLNAAADLLRTDRPTGPVWYAVAVYPGAGLPPLIEDVHPTRDGAAAEAAELREADSFTVDRRVYEVQEVADA